MVGGPGRGLKGPAAAVFLLLLGSFLLPTSASAEGPGEGNPSFAPGRVLVRPRPGAALWALAEARAIPRIGVLSLSVPEGRELETVRRLRQDPAVEFAEPDYLVRAFKTPNDPLYGFYQWNMRAVNADRAWDITIGSDSVVVATLDSGVDLGHSDLAGKLLPGLNLLDPAAPPQDDNGHGTHVAGIAAASGNNGVGVAGMSWGTRLLPVKVLNSQGVGTVGDLARGIIWAVDNGARVLNISGGTEDPSQTLEEALNYAHDVKGALVAAAVGNQGGFGGTNPTFYPAAFPKVLAVAATDSNDRRAEFSQRGPYLDVAAPGVQVLSSVIRGTGPSPFTDYDYKSGTSMAAPHVAGLAALMWSANPALTNQQVARLIEGTALDLGVAGKDELYGAGRIDAYRAVRAAVTGILTATPGSLVFLSDLASLQGVAQGLTLSNQGGAGFAWTAALSPTVSWLSLSGTSGRLEALGPSQALTFTAQPLGITSPGTLTTTAIITGQGDVQNSPLAIPVSLVVAERLEQRFFPWIAASYTGGW